MKIKIKLLTLMLSIGLLVAIDSSAQTQAPPPPSNGGHGSSGNQSGGRAPIGGGSAILLLLVGAYASGKIYNRKKSDISFLQ